MKYENILHNKQKSMDTIQKKISIKKYNTKIRVNK